MVCILRMIRIDQKGISDFNKEYESMKLSKQHTTQE
jgi:hypothetical protein